VGRTCGRCKGYSTFLHHSGCLQSKWRASDSVRISAIHGTSINHRSLFPLSDFLSDLTNPSARQASHRASPCSLRYDSRLVLACLHLPVRVRVRLLRTHTHRGSSCATYVTSPPTVSLSAGAVLAGRVLRFPPCSSRTGVHHIATGILQSPCAVAVSGGNYIFTLLRVPSLPQPPAASHLFVETVIPAPLALLLLSPFPTTCRFPLPNHFQPQQGLATPHNPSFTTPCFASRVAITP
jgi:hypothetical protein